MHHLTGPKKMIATVPFLLREPINLPTDMMFRLQKIAASMDKELLVVKTKWEGLVPALTSGKIDMIIAGMSPTEERKKEIAFSDSYYTSIPTWLFVLIVSTQTQPAWQILLAQKSLPSKGFTSMI